MSQQFLEQIPEEQASCNPSSTFKSIRKQCIRTGLVESVDLFSLPVNLNINGSQIHQTKFGGCIHLLVIMLCIWLSIITFFQHGLYLSSSINQVLVRTDQGDIGENIFNHYQIPIRINVSSATNDIKVDFSSSIFFYAYLVKNDGVTNLTVSKIDQCYPDEFCIMKKHNPPFDIYGPQPVLTAMENSTFPFSRVVIQYFMCKTGTTGCLSWSNTKYQIYIKFPYYQPIRGGYISTFKDYAASTFLGDVVLNVVALDRVYISTNNKFFGHLGNFFPKVKSFRSLKNRDNIQSRNFGYYTNRTALVINPLWRGTVYVISSGKTYTSTQDFDDISSILLFFLSIKETIYFLAIFLIISRYNYNSAFLQISDMLYTMDDHQNSNKYDFQSGGSVLLACLLYKNPICKIFNFILKFKGLTVNDLVPHKCLCAMIMINKTQQILCQKNFFEGLEQLSGLEDLPPKKIVLNEPGEQQQQSSNTKQQVEQQQNYFPNDKLRAEAFQYFCEVNNFHSPNRKNYIYSIISDKSLQLSLSNLLKKQFQYYIKNMQQKTSDNKKFGCQQLQKQDVIPIQLDKVPKKEENKEQLEQQENSAIHMIKPDDKKDDSIDLDKLMNKQIDDYD